MAAVAVVINRSDKFPIGTVVGAFAPVYNRHFGGKPSGTALETRTVDAAGALTFTTLQPGTYALWGEVAGANANMQLGNEAFVAPGTLKERIARRRTEVGA